MCGEDESQEINARGGVGGRVLVHIAAVCSGQLCVGAFEGALSRHAVGVGDVYRRGSPPWRMWDVNVGY